MILMTMIQTGEHSIVSGTWNNVSRMTKRCDKKSYIPRFVHDLNDDDPDRRAQYCEWYLEQCIANDETLWPEKLHSKICPWS